VGCIKSLPTKYPLATLLAEATNQTLEAQAVCLATKEKQVCQAELRVQQADLNVTVEQANDNEEVCRLKGEHLIIWYFSFSTPVFPRAPFLGRDQEGPSTSLNHRALREGDSEERRDSQEFGSSPLQTQVFYD
jgi:hypothetical protein